MKNFKLLFVILVAALTTPNVEAQGGSPIATQLYLQLDDRPDQITVEFKLPTGRVVTTGPFSAENANDLVQIPLDERADFGRGSSFELTIRDSGNDGLSGGAFAINTAGLSRPFPSDNGVRREIGFRIFNGTVGFGSETRIVFVNTDRADIPSGSNTIGDIVFTDISPIVSGGTTPPPPANNNINITNFRAVNLGGGSVNLVFEARATGTAFLIVRNASGRRVFRQRVNAVAGRNTVSVSGLRSRLHIAQITDTRQRSDREFTRFIPTR
ncbi:hypothetical protein [Aquimarina sp. RZ0]|uniref:hypothetical protein n=1 Tax=Aquimarina sp. RZ0 TaxID=2607730 RepID=UPI0011F13185|nr:hypothetical protein [Aquimarina sp. RZ0]KAA1246308.1 hypothetical protein F0000_08420 [Aquimarina sp. RZ0]